MRRILILGAALLALHSPTFAADTSVPNMTAGGAMSDTDLTYCAQSAGTTDRKCTAAQIKTYANTSAVRATTTTTEALANSDQNKLVTFSNAGAVACTIAQAGSGGNFAAGWAVSLRNLGAGTVTCTPTTSTVDGAATVTLTTGQGLDFYSDGTNYFTQPGKGGTTTDASLLTSGTLAAARLPAFTGDCVTTAGAAATTCPIAPPILSGNWYAALPDVYNMTAGSAHNANRIFCRLQIIPHLVTINSLGAGIGTSGTTNVQFALYANTNNRPGAIIGNTGNISNAVSANTQVSGAMAVNKQVGPGGADGGAFLWFCSNQNDSTATYAVGNASNHSQDAMTGDPTLANLITGPANGAGSGVNCLGAGCTGGSSTFGSWPATLAGSTWNLSNPGTTGNVVPVMFYKVN